MSDYKGRTTSKYFTVNEMTELFNWVKTEEQFKGQHDALQQLAVDAHPLPVVYAKQESDGKLVLLGSYPHILLTALYNYAVITEVPQIRKRVLGTKIQFIVLEYGRFQDQLIGYYERAGVI